MAPAVGIGMKSYLGFGKEVTYGTPVARTNFLEIMGESINKSSPLIESAALYRTGILNTRVVQGGVEIAGDFEFEAQYEGWEKLAEAVFGSVSTSNIATGVNRHTFTIADVLPVGLTMEVFRDTSGFASEENKAHLYTGCKVASIGFSSTVGELLRVSCSIVGQNENRAAKTAETFNASRLAAYHQGVINWGNSDALVSAFNVTLSNELDNRTVLGSRLGREMIRAGKLSVAGSFSVEFDSWAKYDDFINATERQFIGRFTGPVITGAHVYYMDIDVPVSIITGIRVNANGPGRIMLEADFKGYRTSTVNEIKLVMQNTLAAI